MDGGEVFKFAVKKVPQSILKKYEGKLPNGLLLLVLSNQKLNSYLKEIGDLCGIGKNITFNTRRHIAPPYSLRTRNL